MHEEWLDEVIATAMLEDGVNAELVADATGVDVDALHAFPDGAKPSARPWTDDEDAYLVQHIQSMSDEALGAALSRTKAAVQQRRAHLRLLRRRGVRPRYMTGAIYDAIVQYKMVHDGIPPTIRWLMETLDISSTSVVSHHLRKLEQASKIEMEGEGRSRQIKVVGGRWMPPADWGCAAHLQQSWTEAREDCLPEHEAETDALS